MKIQLRDFRSEDAPLLADYANNPKIANNLTDQFPHPYTTQHAEGFIAKVSSQNPTQIFAIEFNGDFCGAIGIHPQEDIMKMNAELGYWIAEPYWGKGIVTAAIIQICKYGFDTFDIQRIYARPFGPNLGSQRVLEKASFQLEARFEKTILKNNQFLDELVYAIRR